MQISETETGIVYREKLSASARVLVAFMGLALSVLGLVTMISIGAPLWGVSFWLAVLTCLSLFAFGLLLLVMALGSVKTLEFLPSKRLRVTTRGPVRRNDAEYSFATLLTPEVVIRESEDGRYPVIVLGLADAAKPLELVGFRDESEARHWRDQIAGMLN